MMMIVMLVVVVMLVFSAGMPMIVGAFFVSMIMRVYQK
jgi:hypothetical protein